MVLFKFVIVLNGPFLITILEFMVVIKGNILCGNPKISILCIYCSCEGLGVNANGPFNAQ